MRPLGWTTTNLLAEYTVAALKKLNTDSIISMDKDSTMVMLKNWRNKFPADQKPKMVFLCVSGGGKRAALWTLNAMQTADSLTGGKLMEKTILITGASGGLIGASYYRELKLREKLGEATNPFSVVHRDKISTDNLNPLIFSLLANDLFVGFTKFEYAGKQYIRDRGYTFEQQLNQITEGLMDKPITAYRDPERKALVPMLILTPTVVNDGRKLYIASLPVSFMNSDVLSYPSYTSSKLSGVDFHALAERSGCGKYQVLVGLADECNLSVHHTQHNAAY
jgi:hypothetical protein